MSLQARDFTKFFHAVHSVDPFPWQRMLLERVLDIGWPDLLDLPTASGKTACLDIAVFALAMQARLPWNKRTTPRRIFFVVDRRIVVDEAFDRAAMIAKTLKSSDIPIVRNVADELRRLAASQNGDNPLSVARLRGGIANEAGLPSNPLQPALITGTVDQVGSRMLFRSYGCGNLRAPVDAALVAYDSLIVLDEAHCSVPFCQTAASVRDYLDPKWTQEREMLAPPLKLMVMSATPPAGLEAKARFPKRNERTEALDHPLLKKRHDAEKLATLESCRGRGGQDPLVEAIAKRAIEKIKAGRKRIAVMVNRVRTAHAVLEAISEAKEDCQSVLLTGRMRPIDRDELVSTWSPILKSGSKQIPDKSIVVVTTQCLEVGADFSFEALITECASLDALLQRFGRLDRLGEIGKTDAFILARESDIKEADDPIYGDALAKTWKWLESQNDQPIDFGMGAMRKRISALEEAQHDALLAPHPDAPVLMPAHVDLLCQTEPIPVPDPDVAAYLHGVGRGEPEVRVAFRVDLAEDDPDAWDKLLQLCPPSTQECLSVPLWRMRRWLSGAYAPPPEDVEGIAERETDSKGRATDCRSIAVRRGRAWVICNDAAGLRPGDTIIVPRDPADTVPPELGTGLPRSPIDRADESHWRNKRRAVLRIHPKLLGQCGEHPVVLALREWAETCANEDELDVAALRDILADLAKSSPVPWLGEVAKVLQPKLRVKHIHRHPCHKSAWVISVPLSYADFIAEDDIEDAESVASELVQLDVHLRDTADVARRFRTAMPQSLAITIEAASLWHDLGKIDPRFQTWLRGGDEQSNGELLAKGAVRPRGSSGLRHEMLSVQLLEMRCPDVLASVDRDLLLHIIAAHHGYARPFAPLRPDSDLSSLEGQVNGHTITLDSDSRRALAAPHALGSGIPDRFWRLTRRFGWWGLTYFEMLVRMADWHASANPSQMAPAEEEVAV